MTIPSISKQIATVSKVNTAAASQLFSDRRQNPEEMSCPMWNGMDTAGRRVCVDSFQTKMEGCNTAEDRIFVENSLRPHYSSYVTMDAAGIAGDNLYDSRSDAIASDIDTATVYRKMLAKKTPRFGEISSQKIRSVHGSSGAVLSSNGYTGQDRDAALAQHSRVDQSRVIGSGAAIKVAHHAGDYTMRSQSGANYIPMSHYNKYGTSSAGKYGTLGDMPRRA
jgi:hypothetical protein